MARIASSAASLRFWGDDLDPDAFTACLGRAPTSSQTKGQAIPIGGPVPGQVRIAKTGLWRLKAEDREPGDLDDQISELLGGLTEDLSIWRDLAAKYGSDISVGFFMRRGNEVIVISAESVNALSSRGISISLDIYGPSGLELFFILQEAPTGSNINGATTLFQTVEALTAYVEINDVRKRDYACFATDGRKITLSTAHESGALSTTAEVVPRHEGDVEKILKAYLTQAMASGDVDIDKETISRANLTDLTNLVPYRLMS